jgi:hypothetical protein
LCAVLRLCANHTQATIASQVNELQTLQSLPCLIGSATDEDGEKYQVAAYHVLGQCQPKLEVLPSPFRPQGDMSLDFPNIVL